MKPRNPFSTRLRRVGAFGCGLLASACATLASPTPELLAPIDQALSGDLQRLASEAEVGDPRAQLAMSIVAAHGLHGRPADLSQAAIWRGRALAHRRMMPITQYTAAFDGQASRVNVIHVPVSEIPLGQMAVIDRCLASLESRAIDLVGACGDTPESDASRRMAWISAQR